MSLNYRRTLSVIANVYACVAPLMLVPAIVSFIYGEFRTAVILSVAAVLLFIPALCIKAKIRDASGSLTIREGMLIVAFTWLLFPFYAGLIFLLCGASPSYTDCLFEAVSGVTTTGASVLTDLESLPRGLLFFRSLLQWGGGLGFLCTVTVLMPITYRNRDGLLLGYDSERLGNLNFTISHIVFRITVLYLTVTFIVSILLKLGGLSVYDSVLHTFGCVSTGGFSSYRDNIFHFHNDYIYGVFFVFMFICSISYMLLIMAPKRGLSSILKDSQLRLFVFILILASLIIGVDLMVEEHFNFIRAFKYSGFETLSVMSTSGYNVTNYNAWPGFSKAVIFVLLFIGGCAGSTAGGMKIIRFRLLLKLIKRSIGNRLHPNAVMNISLYNKPVIGDMISDLVSFIFLYIAMIMLGTLAISFDNFDIATNMSAAASCLGNIGPGFNLVGPFSNYEVFSGWSKCVLSFLMICGRLELFWVLGLFSRHFWNPNR